MLAQRLARLQAMCGLSEFERSITLADIDTRGKIGTLAMIGTARKFISRPQRFVTFWGGTGNAKTAVIMGIVNELVAVGCEAVYTTFADLESWVRDAFDEKRHDEFGSARMRIERLANVHVLAVDEFDKVKVTPWLDDLRFSLLDKRYRSGLDGLTGTLLAMNCNPCSLPEWISSRLHDGRNVVIENRDSDMRRLMQ